MTLCRHCEQTLSPSIEGVYCKDMKLPGCFGYVCDECWESDQGAREPRYMVWDKKAARGNMNGSEPERKQEAAE